jgi:hypothetical protein
MDDLPGKVNPENRCGIRRPPCRARIAALFSGGAAQQIREKLVEDGNNVGCREEMESFWPRWNSASRNLSTPLCEGRTQDIWVVQRTPSPRQCASVR